MEKYHRLKQGIPEILGFCVTQFSVSQHLPIFQKYQKCLSRQTTGGELPAVLENTLRFCSWPTAVPPVASFLMLPAWGIPGASLTHPALPGIASWGFVAAIKHRNKKGSFPPVPDTGMEQSRASTGWDKSQKSSEAALVPSLPEWFRNSVVF